MRISEVAVGTILKMAEGGGEYRVTRVSGDEISLEHTRLMAGMDIYLEDLSEMFIGVGDRKELREMDNRDEFELTQSEHYDLHNK